LPSCASVSLTTPIGETSMRGRTRLAITTALGLLAAGVVALPGTSAHAGPTAASRCGRRTRTARGPPHDVLSSRCRSSATTCTSTSVPSWWPAPAPSRCGRCARPTSSPCAAPLYLGGVAYEVPAGWWAASPDRGDWSRSRCATRG
jgi:hypothetical protein